MPVLLQSLCIKGEILAEKKRGQIRDGEGWTQRKLCQVWWCMLSVPAFRRLRQAFLFEFKASLVYPGSSKPARVPY